MHRFIPAYANSFGAKITEVKVHHHPRKFGKAKYGLERTVKVVLDLFTVFFLTSFASKPIYLFGGAGLFLILIQPDFFAFPGHPPHFVCHFSFYFTHVHYCDHGCHHGFSIHPDGLDS